MFFDLFKNLVNFISFSLYSGYKTRFGVVFYLVYKNLNFFKGHYLYYSSTPINPINPR